MANSGTRKEVKGAAPPLTLASAITAGSATLQASGSTTGWPTGAAFPFVISIARGTANEERCLCSSFSGAGPATFNIIQRGYDDTAAAAHNVGDAVEHVLDANTILTLFGHIFDGSFDDHLQYILANGSRAFTGLAAIAGAPVSVGDANAAGGLSTLARSDHVHALSTKQSALTYQDGTARIIVPTADILKVSVPQSSTTFTDLGQYVNVTVPPWATRAIVKSTWECVLLTNNGAQYSIQTLLNNVPGVVREVESTLGLGTSAPGEPPIWIHYTDVFTGLTAGTYQLKTQAKGVGISGAGATIGWDHTNTLGAVGTSFDIEFLP